MEQEKNKEQLMEDFVDILQGYKDAEERKRLFMGYLNDMLKEARNANNTGEIIRIQSLMITQLIELDELHQQFQQGITGMLLRTMDLLGKKLEQIAELEIELDRYKQFFARRKNP